MVEPVPMVREWLILVTQGAIVVIDVLALIVVLVGTAQAFYYGMQVMLSSREGHERRDVWLRYGRWLVAALTFQLAADIIETSITTDWQAVGRIAAVAVIRTFLNFFLDRDIDEVRRRQREVTTGA